jgi:hypothetical protein
MRQLGKISTSGGKNKETRIKEVSSLYVKQAKLLSEKISKEKIIFPLKDNRYVKNKFYLFKGILMFCLSCEIIGVFGRTLIAWANKYLTEIRAEERYAFTLEERKSKCDFSHPTLRQNLYWLK